MRNVGLAMGIASEQGLKVGQNVAAGVAGLVVWPLLFAMDFQDTAGKEVAALQSRQQYLATLAQQKCAPAPHRRRLLAGVSRLFAKR